MTKSSRRAKKRRFSNTGDLVARSSSYFFAQAGQAVPPVAFPLPYAAAASPAIFLAGHYVSIYMTGGGAANPEEPGDYDKVVKY